MPLLDLRISEADWRRVRRALDGSFRSEHHDERGILALLGKNNSTQSPSFTIAEVLSPEPGDVRPTAGGLTFDSRYLRRAHLRMRERGLAGICTFHTHPLSDDTVMFSRTVDDFEDPQLIANLIDIEPKTQLVSVVLGRRSQSGRVWSSPSNVEPLSRLLIVGEMIQMLRLDGSPPPPPPPVEAIFDRAKAITPAGALKALSEMIIAVVGVSGIGSLICELLVRAGSRHLLLIDHDVVELTNLNRMLYARISDIGTAKVQVLGRGVSEAGFELALELVPGTVLDRTVAARLRDADLILGCVDKDWPRDLLADFAFRYLIPYIDLGSEIGSDTKGSTIVSLDARVSYISPGRPCHRCTGVVTARRLRFESLTKAERAREVRLGYSDDLLLSQPAVMDLNMRSASLGALVLRHLLQPFLQMPLPVMLLENIVTYSMRAIRTPRNERSDCPVCRTNRYFGFADCAPPLGHDAALLARIMGTEP